MFTLHATAVVAAAAALTDLSVALGDGAALATLDPALAPLQSDGDDNPFVLFLFLGGFGAMSLYGGWRRYRTSRLVADTPTERVRSMAAGRTELEGVARPRGEPFDEPFGDGEAVIGTYRIEEWEDDDDGGEWKTKEFEKFTAPFYLDDGTGRALVDAESDDPDLHVSDEHTDQWTVGSTESEPEPVAEFLRQRSSLDATSGGLTGVLFEQKRRYTQKVVPPGADAYVFGDAEVREIEEPGSSGAERLVINEDDATGRFIVSDMSEDELASSLGRAALGVLALGVLLLTAAFYVLLTQILHVG